MFQHDAEATRIYLHPALPGCGRPVIGWRCRTYVNGATHPLQPPSRVQRWAAPAGLPLRQSLPSSAIHPVAGGGGAAAPPPCRQSRLSLSPRSYLCRASVTAHVDKRPRRPVINMCHSWWEPVQRLGQARLLLICGGVGKTIGEEPGHTVVGVSLPQLSFGERLAPASVCSCDRFSPISRCSLTKSRSSPQAPHQGSHRC